MRINRGASSLGVSWEKGSNRNRISATVTCICSPGPFLSYWCFRLSIPSSSHQDLMWINSIFQMYKTENYTPILWLFSVHQQMSMKGSFHCTSMHSNYHRDCPSSVNSDSCQLWWVTIDYKWTMPTHHVWLGVHSSRGLVGWNIHPSPSRPKISHNYGV